VSQPHGPQPLVSVVITTFNSGRYLPETLESVFAQTYRNFEVIVVDDGSTDDTCARAREFGSRVILVERPHQGVGPARTAGIERSSGAFVALIDSDDLWETTALQTQVDVALLNPSSGLVIGDGVQFDASGIIAASLFPPEIGSRLHATPNGERTARVYEELIAECPAKCPGQTLMPRGVVQEIGAMCETPNGPQDYDYYLRIARRHPVTMHTTPVVRWRYRPDSMSGRPDERGLRWSAVAIPVLERQLDACPPATRRIIRASIDRRARSGVRQAAVALANWGTRPDPENLATVLRYVPVAHRAVARAVFALPAPAARAMLRATRAVSHRLTSRRRRPAAPRTHPPGPGLRDVSRGGSP
jgi:glycosyltransferase involved in cell wall biosynthesis